MSDTIQDFWYASNEDLEDSTHPAHVLSDPRWIKEYLEQDVKWVTGTGDSLPIKEMSIIHAANCAVWLVRRASSIIAVVSIQDYTEMVAFSDTPVSYVMRTPLYRALTRRADDTEDEVRPW